MKTITINLHCVNDYASDFQKLLLEGNSEVHEEDNAWYSEIDDTRNLIKRSVIDLFPNLKHIIIICTDTTGYESYQFSLIRLFDILSSLDKDKKIKCSLYGNWTDHQHGNWYSWERHSWLYYVHKDLELELKQRYKRITCTMQQTQSGGSWSSGRKQDLLTISTLYGSKGNLLFTI